MSGFSAARALALAVPLVLMAGALFSQLVGGLYPCEYCNWQRLPHYAAIVLAALAFLVPQRGVQMVLVALAGFAIITSGGIGGWHAGIEYGWWEGLTRCSTTGGGSGDILKDIMTAPTVRCDEVQWSLFGISLAGFNFMISVLSGLFILYQLSRKSA
jgi:disulfide bond formation protein DsbB